MACSGVRWRRVLAASPWVAVLLRFLTHLSSVFDFLLWWFSSGTRFPSRSGFVGIVRFAGSFAFYTSLLAGHRQCLRRLLQHQCRSAIGPLRCEKRGRIRIRLRFQKRIVSPMSESDGATRTSMAFVVSCAGRKDYTPAAVLCTSQFRDRFSKVRLTREGHRHYSTTVEHHFYGNWLRRFVSEALRSIAPV